MVITIIPLLILIGTSFEAPGNVAVALSAFGRRSEALLMILVLVLIGLSPRYVTYTVAIVLLYVICVARYFAAPALVQLTDADTRRPRRSY